MRKIFTILIITFVIILVPGCANKKTSSDKINIITTIFPLYDFVKEIGKDKVDVSMILPPGSEAHSFEPKPQDIVKINESAMFIYISETMEPWAHDLIDSIKNPKLIILEAGRNIEMSSEDEHDEDELHEEHAHGGKDPHIWLDFEIDQKIVLSIAEELSKIDPPNIAFYMENAKNYNLKLVELDNRYKETIDKCELKTILYGGHFVFGHLAKRYGLTYITPYEGFSPNSEPAPQKIAGLIETIKKNKFEYLFYEELLDPKVAKSISASTGVKLELLHGAHNLSKDEFLKKITFLSIMNDNLEKLKKGLRYKNDND